MDFNKYFEIKKGKSPIILSCPHGGFLKPPAIKDKVKGDNIADRGTYLYCKRILYLLSARNIEIYSIISKIHRSKVDFNRPSLGNEAFHQDELSSKLAKKIHSSYHHSFMELVKSVLSKYEKCLFIDLHGFTKPHDDYPDIIIGNLFGNTLNITLEGSKNNRNEYEKYWGYSHIIQELSKHFKLDNGLKVNKYNLPYSGGYITYQFYKKENINAFQLEISDKIRENIERLSIFIRNFIKGIDICLKNTDNTN